MTSPTARASSADLDQQDGKANVSRRRWWRADKRHGRGRQPQLSATGRRFYGKSPKGIGYMMCTPKKAYRPDGHPPSIWVREDMLVDGLTGFLATQVFGQY